MKEMIISSSILIAVILLLRWLFRGKVSHRLLYWAWLPAAARLLIPFQFGQFTLSIQNLIDKLETHSPSVQKAQELLQSPVSGPSGEALRQEVVLKYEQLGFNTASDAMQSQIAAEVEAMNNAPTLGQVLFWVWIGGMTVMAVWFLITNALFLLRARKGSVPFPADTPVPVRISPNVPTPCLAGLFRPVIYLTPATAKSPKMVRHILAHELTHRRHGDPVWSFLRCLCLCVHWFNPLVWIAAKESRRDCELACDEGALKKLGEAERFAYGETLIATVSFSRVHLLSTATAMNESAPRMKERMRFIVKKPNKILLAAVAILLIAAIATGCAFAGGAATPTTKLPGEESSVPTIQPKPAEPTVPENTQPPVTQPAPQIPDTQFSSDFQPENLWGVWTAHIKISDHDRFTYTVFLNPDGTAQYQWGYYGSDTIKDHHGSWEATGDDSSNYLLKMIGQMNDPVHGDIQYEYQGILELSLAADGSALQARWKQGNFQFDFYNDSTLILYRRNMAEGQDNYYDIPLQDITQREESV